MDDSREVQDLVERAKFGIEAETFLDGKIGRYLLNRAHQDVDEALQELKTVDPTDAKAITALQNRIYRGESIDNWLAEAIQEGWAAEETLRES